MECLVILSGPSGIGKTPLVKSIARLYPAVYHRYHKLVLYNDREPRPEEKDGVDYHFRTRSQIQRFNDNDRYIIIPMRNDLHALDMDELVRLTQKGDVLYEGNPYVSRTLQTHPKLAGIEIASVFLSPLSKDEINELRDQPKSISLQDSVTEIMRHKLIRRTQRQKGTLSEVDLSDIATRATSAYPEMGMAHFFDYVLPNHDGEDSENWSILPTPIGDARKTTLAFKNFLEGVITHPMEKWELETLF